MADFQYNKEVTPWEEPGVEPQAGYRKWQAGEEPPAAWWNWFWDAVQKCFADIKGWINGHKDANTGVHGIGSGHFETAEGAQSKVDIAINKVVKRDGDTMTGPLLLSGDPTNNLEATTKQYVDNNVVKDFSMDLQYYYSRNIKLIADCESTDGWTSNSWNGIAGTVANDTANFKTGSQGIAISASVTGGGGKLAKVIDLSAFQDGGASTTGDYITFIIYIASSEITKLATGLYLRFLCDSAPTVTNYFYYDIQKASLTGGYNFFKVAKSSFATVGAASWANVKGVEVIFNGAPSTIATFTIDNIRLVRTDPSAAMPNPFQKKVNGAWVRDFANNSGEWFVGQEGGVVTCRNLNPAASPCALLGSVAYSGSFAILQSVVCKTAGSAHGVSWYQDANNYIKAYIDANTLYLTKMEGGVATNVSTALSAVIGDAFSFKIVNLGSSIRLTAVKNGDNVNPVTINTETALSGNGYLGVVTDAVKYGNVVLVGITKNVDNVISSINGHAIKDIFESDGVTVKKATLADTATNSTKLNNLECISLVDSSVIIANNSSATITLESIGVFGTWKRFYIISVVPQSFAPIHFGYHPTESYYDFYRAEDFNGSYALLKIYNKIGSTIAFFYKAYVLV